MENTLLLTAEALDSFFFGPISEDSFFSVGTVIALDGGAWELVETCGSDFIFKASDDITTANENLEFFAERIHG